MICPQRPDTLCTSDADELLELLALGCEYRVAHLVRLCEGALCRVADERNVCAILQYAEAFFLPALRRVCVGVVLRNYKVQMWCEGEGRRGEGIRGVVQHIYETDIFRVDCNYVH